MYTPTYYYGDNEPPKKLQELYNMTSPEVTYYKCTCTCTCIYIHTVTFTALYMYRYMYNVHVHACYDYVCIFILYISIYYSALHL